MRHQKNRLLELNTGVRTMDIYIKTLLTNLIEHGKITTTPKRAKVVKSHADSFFSKLLEIAQSYPQAEDARREHIRYITRMVYGETGKKVLNTILPRYQKEDIKHGFVAAYRLGHRVGDGAEKILLKLL